MQHAQDENLVVVCPEGMENYNTVPGWNTGNDTQHGVIPGCDPEKTQCPPNSDGGYEDCFQTCDDSQHHGYDDVAFIQQILSSFSAAIPKYVLGYSMGGGLAYRILCENWNLIDGFIVWSQPGPYANAYANYKGTGYRSEWANTCENYDNITAKLWVGVHKDDQTFSKGTNRLDLTRDLAETGWNGMSQRMGCDTPAPPVVDDTLRTCSEITCSSATSKTRYCKYNEWRPEGREHAFAGKADSNYRVRRSDHPATTDALMFFEHNSSNMVAACIPTPTEDCWSGSPAVTMYQPDVASIMHSLDVMPDYMQTYYLSAYSHLNYIPPPPPLPPPP